MWSICEFKVSDKKGTTATGETFEKAQHMQILEINQIQESSGSRLQELTTTLSYWLLGVFVSSQKGQ